MGLVTEHGMSAAGSTARISSCCRLQKPPQHAEQELGTPDTSARPNPLSAKPADSTGAPKALKYCQPRRICPSKRHLALPFDCVTTARLPFKLVHAASELQQLSCVSASSFRIPDSYHRRIRCAVCPGSSTLREVLQLPSRKHRKIMI